MIGTLFTSVLLMNISFVYSLGILDAALGEPASVCVRARMRTRAHLLAGAAGPGIAASHSVLTSACEQMGRGGGAEGCLSGPYGSFGVFLGLFLSSSWGHVPFPGVIGIRVLGLVGCSCLASAGGARVWCGADGRGW